MYKENASDKPKNNTPEIIHDFSTDHIDAVDRNTITENNINIQKNISHSIPDNSQLIDFAVCDNMGNNSINSNNNDWLFNDMLTQVRKNKQKGIFPTYQRNIQRFHQYFSPQTSMYQTKLTIQITTMMQKNGRFSGCLR